MRLKRTQKKARDVASDLVGCKGQQACHCRFTDMLGITSMYLWFGGFQDVGAF